MTAIAAREIRFTDAFGPVGWGTSLLAVLLIHLAIAYYFLVYHQIKVEPPPAAPKAILIDLAQPAPLLGPKVAPPAVAQPPAPPIVPPAAEPPSAVPPQTPRIPALAAPAPKVDTAPLPDLPNLPAGEVAPLPKPEVKQPPAKPPETKKAPETKQPPKQTRPTQKSTPSQKALPAAPVTGAMQKANPVAVWQIAVINRLQPYMHWPEDAPYWIDQAAPVVQITIDRQGNVLGAKVVGSSGYDSFDKAARKIFKRATTLPPPPPELPGNPLSFTMSVTFTQRQ
jgi:protein TonB